MGNTMDVLVLVFTTLGLGVLGSLPTIIIGRLLGVKGVVRKKPVQVLASGVVVMSMIRLSSLSEWPVGFQLLICAVCVPMGIYKAELWTKRNG